MSKISFALFALLFSLYLGVAVASSVVFEPSKPCTKMMMCTMDYRPYCVKYTDGTIKQQYGSGSCPPCGPSIAGIYRGMCEGEKFLSPKF